MTPIDIFKEVKALNFPSDHFIVVGSAIMSVKGIRPAYDLDIVISQELFETCKSQDWELKPWTRAGYPGKEWLKKGITDLMLEVNCGNERFDLPALKKEGEVIDGIWFMSLSQLITFKKAYGRPKDFQDIELIQKFLDNKNMSTPQTLKLVEALTIRGVQTETEHTDGHKHVDIFIPKNGMYVEVEGLQHFTNPEQIKKDLFRDYYSDREGHFTFRVTNQLIDKYVNEIADAIRDLVNGQPNNSNAQ